MVSKRDALKRINRQSKMNSKERNVRICYDALESGSEFVAAPAPSLNCGLSSSENVTQLVQGGLYVVLTSINAQSQELSKQFES